MSDLVTSLEILSNAPGISGDEGEVRKAIRPLIRDSVDDLRVDALGNLIAHKAGTGDSDLRVLITAHMDEVGLMVVGHNGDGTLKVDTVGGIPDRLLPGLSVYVGPDRICGVLGLEAIHRASTTSKAPKVSKLAVDIGASSQSQAEELAPLGTSIVFATRFQTLGRSCKGKAFDDRAGCAILISLLNGDPFPFDLYGVFTVQEEVGLRGARVASYTVAPDVGVALEGTLADDLPKEDDDVSPTTELGKGPAITVMDRSYTTPPRLLQHFIRTAQAQGLPFQLKQPGIGGTDAGGIHQARAGVPAITVAVPCRYIHSPVSLLRQDDLSNTAALVDAAIRRLSPETLGISVPHDTD
ncbi:MAG: M42 family peptidase [Anaerolineae bacterium]|nr:M42 family peptidase [Anaerolineae bacterium]